MFVCRTAAKPLHMLPQWSVRDLQQHRQQDSDVEIWTDSSLSHGLAVISSNARFITGSEFPQRIQEIEENRQTAVIRGSGYRSSVIASFFQ